jgi:sugar lactone lactonase YvrE
VYKVAGTGLAGNAASGSALTTTLNQPYTINFIGNDLYFTNHGNHRFQKIKDGNITTIAGKGTAESTGTDGSLAVDANVFSPRGIAIAPDGSMYFSEMGSHKVRRIDMATGKIYHAAGNTSGSSGNAVTALNQPNDIVIDAAGTLYIADYINDRIVMVRGGTPTVFAGGTQGSASNQMDGPQGLAIGPDGYLYVAESLNHRIVRY